VGLTVVAEGLSGEDGGVLLASLLVAQKGEGIVARAAPAAAVGESDVPPPPQLHVFG
jgi:hypothetical protein